MNASVALTHSDWDKKTKASFVIDRSDFDSIFGELSNVSLDRYDVIADVTEVFDEDDEEYPGIVFFLKPKKDIDNTDET